MAGVSQVDSLKNTTLWKQLESRFSESKKKDIAVDLATKVKSACDLATERIRQFAYFHPQFTLHDERHFLRVDALTLLGSRLADNLDSHQAGNGGPTRSIVIEILLDQLGKLICYLVRSVASVRAATISVLVMGFLGVAASWFSISLRMSVLGQLFLIEAVILSESPLSW